LQFPDGCGNILEIQLIYATLSINETPALAFHGVNLGVETIIDYDKGIQEEASRTMPIYATHIGHTQSIASVQELHDKNISCVHMPYFADCLACILTS